jgi:flavodoxin
MAGLKALIIYFSATGNTRRVAETINEALADAGIRAKMLMVKDAAAEELLDYDLVFLGAPSYGFLPAEPVLRYIQTRMDDYRDNGTIKPGAPRVPGKTAVPFCTYSGPHTGVNEAIPAVKYMGQLFEHIGFAVAGEWCIVGEFHNNETNSTRGRLGDIRGRPNREDLARVRADVDALLKSLASR